MDYYNPPVRETPKMTTSEPTDEADVVGDHASVDSEAPLADESYDGSDECEKENESERSRTSSPADVDEGVELKEEDDEKEEGEEEVEKQDKKEVKEEEKEEEEVVAEKSDAAIEDSAEGEEEKKSEESSGDASTKKSSAEKLRKFFGENHDDGEFQMSKLETLLKEKWSDLACRYHRIKERDISFDGFFATVAVKCIDFPTKVVSLFFIFYFLLFSMFAQVVVPHLPAVVAKFVRRIVPEPEAGIPTPVADSTQTDEIEVAAATITASGDNSN